MHIKKIRTLQNITGRKLNRISPRPFLNRIFMLNSMIYAANDWMVCAIGCEEIEASHPNYDNWVALDYNTCNTFGCLDKDINLNDPAILDWHDDTVSQCNQLGNDYFSRFFSMRLPNGEKHYDPVLLRDMAKVFEVFGLSPKIQENMESNSIYFTANDDRYKVSVFIMPQVRR